MPEFKIKHGSNNITDVQFRVLRGLIGITQSL